MGKTKAILIADDNEDDIALLKHVLRQAGVVNPMVEVRNGEETVNYFQGEGIFADREKFPLPSILLLDLRLPALDGFEVLERLRRESRLEEVLVVIVTGDWEMRGVERAYKLGAKSFLVKPCKLLDILNLTRTFPGPWLISSPANPK